MSLSFEQLERDERTDRILHVLYVCLLGLALIPTVYFAGQVLRYIILVLAGVKP